MRSQALKKAQAKYESKRRGSVRLPGARITQDEKALVDAAIKKHGGSAKETVLCALKLFLTKDSK